MCEVGSENAVNEVESSDIIPSKLSWDRNVYVSSHLKLALRRVWSHRICRLTTSDFSVCLCSLRWIRGRQGFYFSFHIVFFDANDIE